MKYLDELIECNKHILINGISEDSRDIIPNSIFFCVEGISTDGHSYIDKAIDNGAVCIVHSKDVIKKDDIIHIKVNNVLDKYIEVVNKFYDNPSKKLFLVGVTGTNGKTSITKMLSELLPSSSYIGTLGIEYGNHKTSANLTTPTIKILNSTLNNIVKNSLDSCMIEVSSIGIDQRRIDGLIFDVAIFTNFTHDHLDYHKTMENYFLAKKKFFDNLDSNSYAVINIDDEYGLKIISNTKAKVITYGINNDADFKAVNIDISNEGISFTLVHLNYEYKVKSNLLIEFNVYNLLAVIITLYIKGYSIDEIIPKLTNIKQIGGRIENIKTNKGYNVIVDFAHTPDGVEKMLQFSKKITKNKVILVIGSAGGRDTLKRGIFGTLANEYADYIILTEDDPRDEEPYNICNDIAINIDDNKYEIIINRESAIKKALDKATKGDIVLILGKGNDNFMYRLNRRDEYLGDSNIVKGYF